ncbi:MAG TPA: hypothetical protein VF849_01450 [Blattabacteriaceae bacterium]
MKIVKKQFESLYLFYECKLGVESITQALSNLKYFTGKNKELLDKINEAHKILKEIEFEK